MPDGRFVVSWYDNSADAKNTLTEVRVFNPDGTPATEVFAIPGSTESGNGFGVNDVTALGNTSFAVDWKTTRRSRARCSRFRRRPPRRGRPPI